MKIAVAFAFLASTLAMPAVFEPTDEWQFVPDGVAVPGGLEIRMDLNKGGRWARLLQGTEAKDDSDNAIVEVTSANTNVDADKDNKISSVELTAAPKPPLQISMLPELEDKAHDFDDGAEIIQNYGAQLLDMYNNPSDPGSDSAGRVLTICLRNNYEAALAVVKDLPHLVEIIKLSDRPVNLLSALVSTSPGINMVKNAGILPNLRRELAYATEITPTLAKNIVKLLQNLAVSGGDDERMCDWVDALTQAYFTTHNETLREVAVQIVEHTGDFENLKVHCRPQPGLLSVQNEAKRAAETSDQLANPMARRNHFDEL